MVYVLYPLCLSPEKSLSCCFAFRVILSRRNNEGESLT